MGDYEISDSTGTNLCTYLIVNCYWSY